MRSGKILKKMVSQILDCIVCDKSRLDKKTAKVYDDKDQFEIYIPRDLRIIFYDNGHGHIDFVSNLWYVSGLDFKKLSGLLLKKTGG